MTASTTSEPSPFEWGALLARLRARRRLVIGMATVGICCGVIWWALTPRTWTANARFVPQVRRGAQSQPLNAITAQLGISVPSGDAMNSPQFYADLVLSREVLRAVLAGRVAVSGEDSVALLTLVQRWKKPSISQDDALQYLADAVGSAVAPRTGVVSVTVTLRDRKAAVSGLNAILAELDRYNRDRRRSQSTAERRFTEERLVEARQDLRDAEDRLQAFLQRNREVVSSANARFDRDRLDRDLMEKQSIYSSMSQANQQSRIEEVRDTPLLTIVEAPDARERGNSRGSVQRVGVSLLTGTLLGIGLALWSSGTAPRRRGR